MELWQMDVVGGFVLADGRRAKALTGIDDHSRFCVSAYLIPLLCHAQLPHQGSVTNQPE